MKTIMEMAREAGFGDYTVEALASESHLLSLFEAFVALVRADECNRTWTQQHWTDYERSIAAAEREACAKEADYYSRNDYDTTANIAAAIRARGQA